MERCIEARLLERGERVTVDEMVEKLWNCGDDVGAVLVYIGRVKGRDVRLVLDVEDVSKALDELRSILENVASRHSRLRGAILYTYTGERRPAEPVAYIAVAAVDRFTALKSLEELVNAYKSLNTIKHKEVKLTS